MKTIRYEDAFAKFPKRVQGKIKVRAQELRQEMLLRELRESLKITQEQVAERTGLKTPNVSRLERQSQMQMATLRKVVQALGGQLEIIARFEDTAVKIVMPGA